ncbi:MAG: hypothetical protein WCA49_22700 [Candidatus Sulfotelmatobacter sp.]
MRLLPGLSLFLCAGIAIASDTPQQLAVQALQQTAKVCQNIQNSQQCHTKYLAGCAKTANSEYDPYLNFFKNQLVPPTSQAAETLDPQKLQTLESATPSQLALNNHRNFSSQFVQLNEGEIVQATGYLYYAQQTSAESCNCERSGPKDSDYHIGLGFDASKVAEAKAKPTSKSTEFHDLQSNSMIVEITPYYRAKNEPSWTLAKLEALYGAQVKVVGQLIADNDHYAAAEDCGMKGSDPSSCWRLSIWEIHPVTAFYICTTGSDCATTNSGWTKLEDWNPPSSGEKHRSGGKPSSAQ